LVRKDDDDDELELDLENENNKYDDGVDDDEEMGKCSFLF
jgi:hypothetical protein